MFSGWWSGRGEEPLRFQQLSFRFLTNWKTIRLPQRQKIYSHHIMWSTLVNSQILTMVILHIKAGKINYSQTSGGGANRFIPNFLSPLPDQKSHLTPWADSENYLFLKKIGKKDRKFREATCQNSHIFHWGKLPESKESSWKAQNSRRWQNRNPTWQNGQTGTFATFHHFTTNFQNTIIVTIIIVVVARAPSNWASFWQICCNF